MPPPVGSTWEMFIAEQVRHGPGEVELKTVQPGDQLEVVTKNTRYEFEWRDDGSIILRTDRTDRPWGPVTLVGSAFPQSGIVAPGVVFRGGKLEYVTMDGKVRHRTTVITALTLVRREDRVSRPESARRDTAG